MLFVSLVLSIARLFFMVNSRFASYTFCMSSITLICRFEAGVIFILKNLYPDKLFIEAWRKKNVSRTIFILKKKLAKNNLLEGCEIEIDRKNNISEREFIKNYFKKNIPLVFSNQADNWACCKNWSIKLIKEKYPNRSYNILDWPNESVLASNDPGHINTGKKVSKVTGAELVDLIESGQKVYLRGCPIIEEDEKLIDDLDNSWLQKMRRCFFGASYQSFISSGNSKAPIHNESTSFFFIMIEGEKKWTLFNAQDFAILNPVSARIAYNYTDLALESTDKTRYRGVEYLDRYVCNLKKGDVLFVPAWMWHTVHTPVPSWAISYKYTSIRSFFSSYTFSLSRLFIAKPNIFYTLYYSFFKTDMGSREKNLLVPKLFIKKK
jgi:hypothetical protein